MTTTIPPQQPVYLTFELAFSHHQAGRRQEAEDLYLAILKIDPTHPEANHNMGILAMQMKQPAASLPYFMAALDANPACAQYWLSGIDALFQADQLDAAQEVLTIALQQGLQGDSVDALVARINGNTAIAERQTTDHLHPYKEPLPFSSTTAQDDTEAPALQEVNALVGLFNEERYAEAAALAQTLTVHFPLHGFGWKVLGAALKQMGRSADALEPMQKAATLSPNDADTHSNLGNTLKDLGRLDEAEASCRQALQIKPDYAEAHNNLSITLQELGRLDEAEASCREALQLKPDYAEVHNSLSVILQQQGRIDEAEASCRQALQIKPDYAEAHNNLSVTLQKQGRLDEAEASCRRALQIMPNYAEAHNNLSSILHELGRPEEAEASCRLALQLMPDYAEAHNNLGVLLREQRQSEKSEASCRRALQLKPNYADAHNNLGNTLQDLGQLDDALDSFQRALKINPACVEAHNNLGNVLRDLGRLEEAATSYRQALKLESNCSWAYSNLLYLHAFTRNISPESECTLASNWENIALNENERIVARNRTLSFDNSLAHSPRIGRKLKIGVVSAEIGQNAVAEFLEPFLEQLDHSRFHVTLFPTTAKLEARTARIKKLADEFKPLVGIPDKKAADLIRSDQIDILIDTTAHMGGCRLGIFAHRAAPVQCHYIGYHGTTGLTEMDWFIADEVLLPSTCDAPFCEGIWRLPRLWISYRGDSSLPNSYWTPSLDGTVWLGSFNNLAKVREETLALWAKVMNAIPESKLFLKDRQSGYCTQKRIKMELYRHGIDNERVQFADHVPDWSSHMALYDKLDIALDTIPLNSGTTAFDALWMGVPFVALEGNWMGGRLSTALLKALGKTEWIAQDEKQYVAIVSALAQDIEGRKSLRVVQRALMANSPLCDAKGLTRALEDAFEKMFDQWMDNRRKIAHTKPMQQI